MPELTIYPPSTVILQDKRDPDVSWARHERTAGANRGGVDVVAAVGTPVYAWADGVVRTVEDDGSAGNVIRLALTGDLGWTLDYKHLSRFAVPDRTLVKRGYLIGYSGDSGAPGQPHVHLNLVDPSGIRRNPWKYAIGNASAAPIGEEDMSYTEADRKRDDAAAWNIGQIKGVVDDMNAGAPSKGVRAKLDLILYSLEGNGGPSGLRAIAGRIAKKLGV